MGRRRSDSRPCGSGRWCRGVTIGPFRVLVRSRDRVISVARRMGRRYDTISLLTDYGHTDEFVGVVKSVIRDIAPHVVTIDLTHDLPPFDVRAGGARARAVHPLRRGGHRDRHRRPGRGDRSRRGRHRGRRRRGRAARPRQRLARARRRAGRRRRARRRAHQPGVPAARPGPDVRRPRCVRPGRRAPRERRRSRRARRRSSIPTCCAPGVVPLTRREGDTVVGEVLWVDRFGNAQVNVDPDEIDDLGERVGVTIGGIATRRAPSRGVRRARTGRARTRRRLVRLARAVPRPRLGRGRAEARGGRRGQVRRARRAGRRHARARR